MGVPSCKPGLVGIALLLAVISGVSRADTLNVAVASNFAETLEAIASEFEAASAHEVRIIRGSSGKHYAQIVNGAPFDVFLSADQARPARLVEEGRGVNGSLRTYAVGQLALWSREVSISLGKEYLLNTNNYATIAIANPRLAPYGQAALQALDSLGIDTENGAIRLVLGENIAQAFQFAYSGSADLGLIAYAQTQSQNLSNRGSLWRVPASLHDPIRQDMVVLTDSVAAKQFAAFMEGEAATAIIIKNGYLAPTLDP